MSHSNLFHSPAFQQLVDQLTDHEIACVDRILAKYPPSTICPDCATAVPADEPCPICGHSEVSTVASSESLVASKNAPGAFAATAGK